MLLNTKNKSMLRMGTGIVIGSVLCIFLFIPFLSALALSGISLIAPQSMSLLHILLFEAVAFGASGFLMSLIISSISIDKKIIAALFGALIVTVFCVAQHEMITSLYALPQKSKHFFSIEIGMCIISLWAFGYLGAWLIARRRRLKKA